MASEYDLIVPKICLKGDEGIPTALWLGQLYRAGRGAPIAGPAITQWGFPHFPLDIFLSLFLGHFLGYFLGHLFRLFLGYNSTHYLPWTGSPG